MNEYYQTYWAGQRIDNRKTLVFSWSGKFWHEILDGVTIKNDFREVSNNAHTVVIDQGAGPLFLTPDGAYWAGRRYAIGTFDFRRHEAWSGRRPTGESVEFKWNEESGFWDQIDGGAVVKDDFREVENNAATVTIDQGAGPIYLMRDGAYYAGNRWALGTFTLLRPGGQ